MAITWKKLATYNEDGSQISGTITGKALGGLSEVLSKADGGTGTALQTGSQGALLMSNGSTMVWSDPPQNPGEYMVSDGSGSWVWTDLASSHNHDNDYIALTGQTQHNISGNFTFDGALEVTGEVIFANPIEITNTTQNNGSLGSGVGGDGDGSGWFIDADEGLEGTPESQDPCMVWRTNIYSTGAAGWVCGKYATDERLIQTFYPDDFVASTPPASVQLPGVWAQSATGEVFMSVVSV